MRVSIIVPMYNEAGNVQNLVAAVSGAMIDKPEWELLLCNDGSTDDTLKLANEMAASDSRVKIVTYDENHGQGYALREGFKCATGDIIVTLDADLSYDPALISALIKPMTDDRMVDIVIGSPYLKGGGVEGVPFFRLLLSRGANRLLGIALPGRLHTVTGILRAYRADFLHGLEWDSRGKEIHFEILSKGLATGASVVEVPAVLRGRERGHSTIRVRAAILSHLVFSFFERPAILFEAIGAIMLALGIASGIYIIWLWRHAALDPTRPLVILMVLLIVVGAIVLSFGFIASQIVQVRKEIYRVQKGNLMLRKTIMEQTKKPKDV
ncbi:MAG: glycosyltransferase family 2 protein [Actinomycetota bacterium]